jgi:hypothetical protein
MTFLKSSTENTRREPFNTIEWGGGGFVHNSHCFGPSSELISPSPIEDPYCRKYKPKNGRRILLKWVF